MIYGQHATTGLRFEPATRNALNFLPMNNLAFRLLVYRYKVRRFRLCLKSRHGHCKPGGMFPYKILVQELRRAINLPI